MQITKWKKKETIHCGIPTAWHSRKDKTMEASQRLLVARVGKCGEGEEMSKESREDF